MKLVCGHGNRVATAIAGCAQSLLSSMFTCKKPLAVIATRLSGPINSSVLSMKRGAGIVDIMWWVDFHDQPWDDRSSLDAPTRANNIERVVLIVHCMQAKSNTSERYCSRVRHHINTCPIDICLYREHVSHAGAEFHMWIDVHLKPV